MSVKILDCTLRDGGYINNFDFGKKTIRELIQKLGQASIDIIECGFLQNECYEENKTLFGNFDMLKKAIGTKNKECLYVAMIQYGKYDSDEVPDYDGTSIDGIRVTFHEHEIEDALFLGKSLINKGYKVFMQPVGTLTYSDNVILDLIMQVNLLKPYAFYFVDTLGNMYKNDLLRLFYLINNNLDPEIVLGYHSHNNLQLAFSNAQELIQVNDKRNIIIDASVYGMGRGAGNLCTELITQFINKHLGDKYNIDIITEIMDDYILPLRIKYSWGYNAAYFISAVNNCHPNYAVNLLNKQTLLSQDMNRIINMISTNKKTLFDKEYIELLYLRYMENSIVDKDALKIIKKRIGKNNVLIIAPGNSLTIEESKILNFIKKENPCIISVNFVSAKFNTDIAFFSNSKRFDKSGKHLNNNCLRVITSNIAENDGYGKTIKVDYLSYINEEAIIVDNAGLMCINLLRKIGINNIFLAGFDGFHESGRYNYFKDEFIMSVDSKRFEDMNRAIAHKLNRLKKEMKITFITESIFAREL